ncbi:MAG TPA: zinc-dependent metalloprotease [Bacteroidota bacterium]
MKNFYSLLVLIITIALFAGCASGAKTMQDAKPAAQQSTGTKTIKEVVKSSKKYDGLLTLFQDSTDGSIHMLIKKDQLNKEYIYFSSIVNGIVDVGQFRGGYRDNKIFSVRKYFNRIEFVNENTSFYFDPLNALHRAADANISPAILTSQKIVAQDSAQSEYLIKADDLFLTEHLQLIKPVPSPNARPGTFFNLGTLSKEKSKIAQVKNYPANTDIVVDYVYENPAPLVWGGSDVTDARFVTISLQHSLIEVPQNDFLPRSDDPRIGYFRQEVTDLTSTSATPYRDMITRWHLKKKDPSAQLSEPIEPIVWWVENTTPVQYRETIKNAALAWNIAFEHAGFKNAVQVKIQPDDAAWDAGDIRYNVLRWTSSPRPPFGGFGPSFINPRTGQIIGADVMLEYNFITQRLRGEELFSSAGIFSGQPDETQDPSRCMLGAGLQLQILLGLQVLETSDASGDEKNELIRTGLYFLVLHEVGHTLGLNHNMKASYWHTPVEIHNKAKTSTVGLMASVMDYPAINYAKDKGNQGEYCITVPGPYDRWAIEYGYSPALREEVAEQTRLSKILARSADPSLIFGNDADDMRAPGKAIDPRVMLFDLTSDPLGYAEDRLKLIKTTTGKLREKYNKPARSYHELRNAYLILTGELSNQMNVVSRQIGGVYVDRAFVGQPGASKPFTPVSKVDQKRAMDILARHLFSVEAFREPAELYDYLQQQRRGFNFFSTSEDPKIHDRVLTTQKNVLNHLLHQNVLTRIVDSHLYGNQYSLSEFMGDLTGAIFKDDAKTNVQSFRQNVQMEYINRLAAILSDDGKTRYGYPAQSMAVYQLTAIQKILTGKTGTNTETAAHTQHVLLTIQNALDAGKK